MTAAMAEPVHRHRFTLLIQGRVPPSENQMRRKYAHEWAYKKLREGWEADLKIALGSAIAADECKAFALECKKNKIPIRVEITAFRGQRGKLLDPDNADSGRKVVFDALRNIGFLWDDTANAVDAVPVKQIRAARNSDRTLIYLD